jgi:NAD(P)-dependent dehydrogenase (short-subunit alcohol dehydrogenase family)
VPESNYTEFSNKVVCITGAGSGIGRQTALQFAKAGAKIMAADFDPQGLEETVQLIADAGVDVQSMSADVSKPEQVEALVEKCLTNLGGLDVFFANAGITGPVMALNKADNEGIARVIEVNILGPIYAVKYAGPVMLKQGHGSIVLTASIAGMAANAGPIPYSASKAAVINLAKTAAQELAGSGVRVNAVCPGLVETSMTQSVFDYARHKESEDMIGQLNPSHRTGLTEDIANAVMFLASDKAAFVNGQALAVDGGLSSSHPYARPFGLVMS